MTSPTTTHVKFCHACGRSIDARAEICPLCGVRQPMMYTPAFGAIVPSRHDRVAAALFALFLGCLGAHKFYLGKIGQGIVYLLFCWTAIPALVGIVEGIIYLTKTDEEFAEEYG